MASLDLGLSYEDIQKKIDATKTYNDLKSQYDSVTKRAGNSFEEKKENVTQSIDQVRSDTKRFQKKIKNQFEQLLDINNITSGRGGGTVSYVKRALIETIQNIEPKLKEILSEEAVKAVGCDLQQTYTPQDVYIKVKSTDLLGVLKYDPQGDEGKVFYEKSPIIVQNTPFSMNRELYDRIQSNNPYSSDNGQLYKGKSGQNLFDLQFVEFDNNGVSGPWWKVSLVNRIGGVNKVGEFLSDYYGSIKVTETTNIMASIMESLSGAVSISANVGIGQVEDQTKFDLILQRILGLCFDSRAEIDVSGIAKLAELDGIDESFFEFTEVDLRNILNRVENIKNGVTEFEGCENVKIPVDTNSILDSLNNLNFVDGSDQVDLADQLTDNLINQEAWDGIGLDVDVRATVNFNFIKLIARGIVGALFSPKSILPLHVMSKTLGNAISNDVNSAMDFATKYPRFIIEVVSKVGGIFVEELFNIIKRDIGILVQQVITDLVREKINKKLTMILKLIQIVLLISTFISDWRKCKSVVDEILALLALVSGNLPGGNIPTPLLFASRLLDGYSESRAFIGTIEELQKLGIPTGALPDGSPNLDVLSKFGQMKSMAKEEAENGKVQLAIGPLIVTPAGLTAPASWFGKKI
jgi:hypothetical protein